MRLMHTSKWYALIFLILSTWTTHELSAQRPKQRPAKPARPAEVGPAIRENKATPIDRITVAEGFQVELLYSVPGQDQGSWVNLCVDPDGKLLVSDQYGGLYRVTPPPAGGSVAAADVQKVPVDIRAVNGMLYAFGALYVAVNDYEDKIPSGLYRITDSDQDGELDKAELLRELQSGRDHGVHALLPTPDGEALYLVCGNKTSLTEIADSSPVPQVWGEDHLLPRMPDGRGFMRDTLGPGGVIYRVTPDGKTFEAFANGFRNVFDAAVNRNGELFTYDADMEYDFNTSWYRPTRINHVVSGAEFGWRNGAGKRPPFYADNLPAVLDIGPGSPTGVTFGYGAKFPAKYQDALYALDWSWGKLYAIHLEPDGASYRASKEEFLTGAPLPITDAVIHPGDGAMYFTIGGRRVQSGLYRVTYVGNESTKASTEPHALSEAMKTRRSLEAYHGIQEARAIEVAWPHLAHPDRFVRWAARVALEHQPVEAWQSQALTESNPATQVEALLALARAGGVCPSHRVAETPAVDAALGTQLLSALLKIEPRGLNHEQQLTWLRTIQIALHRFEGGDPAIREQLIERLDPLFPAQTPELNWLLCETLAWLESPTVAAKAMALIAEAPTQEEQIEYARSLRLLQAGWTPELRTAYFEWLLKAANYRGGASFERFIQFIRDDAIASLSESERQSMAELLARKPESKPVLESLATVFEGRSSHAWSIDELASASASKLQGRDFATGRTMFAAAGCYACHRFNNQGGMTGPDLTSAGRRYSTRDLIDQIIDPSKVINEQFSAIMVLTLDGQVHRGVVVNLSGDSITLNTDLTDPNQRVSIDRKQIEELTVSNVSPMPAELLNRMTEVEVMDLLAYILSGGDPAHEVFRSDSN